MTPLHQVADLLCAIVIVGVFLYSIFGRRDPQ